MDFRSQAIIKTNAGLLLIGPFFRTNFSDILIKIKYFSLMKMHLKVSCVKRRHFVQSAMIWLINGSGKSLSPIWSHVTTLNLWPGIYLKERCAHHFNLIKIWFHSVWNCYEMIAILTWNEEYLETIWAHFLSVIISTAKTIRKKTLLVHSNISHLWRPCSSTLN